MTFPKQTKSLGRFEALEAKKLFAADLTGIAVPVEVAVVDPGDCPDVMDPNDCPNLGGQEGEPVVDAVDYVFQISDTPEGSLSAIAGP